MTRPYLVLKLTGSQKKIILHWAYHPKDDYFIDPQEVRVRVSFYDYRKRKDKYGFVREFKEYKANKLDKEVAIILH